MLEVIVNPASRSGRGVKAWKKLKPYFDETGVSYRVHFSGNGKGISDMVNRLTSKQPSDIVIIGGDGSFNEAVNGIADFEGTRLGFIPIGSGNDLARALEIPKNNRELVKKIAELKTLRKLDIGCLETEDIRRLFNISCGMGFDALICRSANISRLKTFGQHSVQSTWSTRSTKGLQLNIDWLKFTFGLTPFGMVFWSTQH